MPSPALCRRLLCLLLATGGLTVAALATPETWKEEIGRFAAADAVSPPPQDAVVFVGSSSIRYWTTLADDFPGVVTLNRGFGGSELADSVYYADRIVLPYHPRLVVLYAGENDLNAGKTPESVAADFQAFRRVIHATLPSAKIIFLAIKASPVRARIHSAVARANALIAADCRTDPRCTFVDVATPLLNAAGGTRAELFREDQLHMQPAGYAIWARVLRPHLQP